MSNNKMFEEYQGEYINKDGACFRFIGTIEGAAPTDTNQHIINAEDCQECIETVVPPTTTVAPTTTGVPTTGPATTAGPTTIAPTLPPGVVCSIEYINCTDPGNKRYVDPAQFGLGCSPVGAPDYITIDSWCYRKNALSESASEEDLAFGLVVDCSDPFCQPLCSAEYEHCNIPGKFEYLDLNPVACNFDGAPTNIIIGTDCYTKTQSVAILATISTHTEISGCNDVGCNDICTAEYISCTDPSHKEYLDVLQFGFGCTLDQTPDFILYESTCFEANQLTSNIPTISGAAVITDCDDPNVCTSGCTAQFTACNDPSDKRYLGMSQFGEFGCVSLGQAGVPSMIKVGTECYNLTNWPDTNPPDIDSWTEIANCNDELCSDYCAAEYTNCTNPSDIRYLGMSQFGEFGCISLVQAGVPDTILVDNECYTMTDWPVTTFANISTWTEVSGCSHASCP